MNIKTVLKVLAAIAAIMLVLAGVVVGWFYQDQRQWFNDPVFDSEPPVLPQLGEGRAVLVFTKTNGYRHREGIEGGLQAFESLAQEKGWALFATENGAVFNQHQLSKFDAVVWLCTTGPALDQSQQLAFKTWLENGGGYIGLHAAGDSSHESWAWYTNEVIGAPYLGHTISPHTQDARVVVEAEDHPIMGHLPAEFMHHEEWYGFKSSPRRDNVTVLARVDETSFEPGYTAMGDDHPVIWIHPQGKGRVFYSVFGHYANAYDSHDYMQLLSRALDWVVASPAREIAPPPPVEKPAKHAYH